MKSSLSRIFRLGKAETSEPVLLNFLPQMKVVGYEEDTIDVSRIETQKMLIEREAYEKGFAAGEKAGMEMGKEKTLLQANRLLSVIDELSYFKDKYYADKEMEIIDIIVKTAEKVIQTELSINMDIVVNITKSAINAMVTSERLTVKLNPDDIEYLLSSRPDFLKNLQDARGFIVEGDNNVGKGGCIVESNHGEVDARIEEGLKIVGKEMREAVKK
ncbi:MAG: hypothetical protein HZC45_08745 [Deltaproteobacteria bacterium]|nr:hypothetical protein [Deltaproteobacteria bacterium]